MAFGARARQLVRLLLLLVAALELGRLSRLRAYRVAERMLARRRHQLTGHPERLVLAH